MNNSDNASYRYPVSIKGVVISGGKVVLLQNERDEWELPGGKLDPGETPQQCLRRELSEELGVTAETGELLDVWVYEITAGVRVLIVTFGVRPLDDTMFTLSAEHKRMETFHAHEIAGLDMPAGYKASISAWLGRSQSKPA